MTNYGIHKLKKENGLKINDPKVAAHIVHGLARGHGNIKASAVAMGKNLLFGTNVIQQIAAKNQKLNRGIRKTASDLSNTQKAGIAAAAVAAGVGIGLKSRMVSSAIRPLGARLEKMRKFFSSSEPQIFISKTLNAKKGPVERFGLGVFKKMDTPISQAKPYSILHGFGIGTMRKEAPKHIMTYPGGPAENIVLKQNLMKDINKAGIGIETNQLSKNIQTKLLLTKSNKEALNVLDSQFGKNKYILKPVTDFTLKNDIGAVMRKGQESLIHSGTKSFNQVELLRKKPGFFIQQPKLDIAKEYRVRTVNGEVVAMLNRYPSTLEQSIAGKGGFGFIPYTKFSKERQAVEQMFMKHRNVLDQPGANTLAYDIAKLKNGKLAVIEKNITTGGDLENPFVSEAVYQAMTGRTSRRAAIAKGVLAGIGISAAGTAGVSAYNNLGQNQAATG